MFYFNKKEINKVDSPSKPAKEEKHVRFDDKVEEKEISISSEMYVHVAKKFMCIYNPLIKSYYYWY